MNQLQKGDTSWFTHDRFGLFIHWGLYALLAHGEWIPNIRKNSCKDYENYFQHFNPDLFNPREWSQATRRAGMKYSVVTVKHHEGFCLWDTKQNNFKSTNTHSRRDLLAEIVQPHAKKT